MSLYINYELSKHRLLSLILFNLCGVPELDCIKMNVSFSTLLYY